jgi:hypothetical protein
VLVVHGLNASKEFMQMFCAALADAGFDVYAIDLPGHGDSPVGFTASLARDAVAQSLDYLGAVNIVVGHSLGAGLLLDVANSRSFERMVLLSPPPTPVDHIDFSHTLVVTGAFDIPAINAFVPELEGAEWWRLPWALHSTALFDPNNTWEIIRWLGGDVTTVRAAARRRWNLLMLLSSIALGICTLTGGRGSVCSPRLSSADLIGRFVLAGTAAAIILNWMPFMRWLHLFATDYLIGMIFVIGVILCATLTGRTTGPYWRRPTASFAFSIFAVAYAIGVIGFVASAHLMHFALGYGRWWRFPCIAAAGFPLFYFDEVALRTDTGPKASLLAIFTRILIGAAILMGVLTLERANGLLVIITHLIVLFWAGLWFLTGFVRRYVKDPVAAAVFASLVQGWLFAAWFVII